MDTLTGGSGADILDGGGGTDTADYSASTQAVQISLDTGGHDGGLQGMMAIAGGGDTLTALRWPGVANRLAAVQIYWMAEKGYS